MNPHLPDEVRELLQRLTFAIVDSMESDGHTVTRAKRVHRAFKRNGVDSPLTRALIATAASEAGVQGVQIEDLANLGVEATIVHDGIVRRFRFRRATVGRDGRITVTCSSDSFLTKRVVRANLFDDEQLWESDTFEQWVYAYTIDRRTHTLAHAEAAFAAGFANERSPYRLILEGRTPMDLHRPVPPKFTGSVDDLDLEDREEEDGGEADGTASA